MNYGNFCSDGKVYKINNIKTPTPWKNLLFNDEYFMETSQRLCGASYAVCDYKRRPVMADEKEFYIKRDGKTYSLCRGTGISYVCEHYIHKTVVCEDFGDFTTQITVFVPESGARELWQIEVVNKTKTEAETEIYACFSFADIPHQGLKCWYNKDKQSFVKYCFPYYIKFSEYDGAKNGIRYSYAKASEECDSFECNKHRFRGGDNPFDIPDMVKNGAGTEKICEYEDAVAAFCHKVKITDKKSISYVIGNEMTEADIYSMQFPDFDEELEKAENKWNDYLDCFYIKNDNKHLEYMVNYWQKKQMVYLLRHNRGGVYCPVRNQLQDALGYSTIDAKTAYEYAMKVLRRQHENGYLKQWYMTDLSPDTGLCLLNHSDAPIWLVICVTEIIEQGKMPEKLYETEKYFKSEKEDSILEHLKNAVKYMYSERGEHGLCLMKDGDWTDPMNGPGRLGRGESVWNTMALVYAIKRLSEISNDDELMPIAEELTENINKYCWDCDRYIAGYDDNGNAFGCKNDKEASLFLNTQTWAVISGVCGDERLSIIKNTLKTLWTEYGYRLLYPAFSDYNETWGKISVKYPGTTENGAVYMHGNMFKAYSDCVAGDFDEAIKTISAVLPKNNNENDIQIPTYLSNYYFGTDTDNFGRSSCAYSTGATAWLLWIAKKYFQ